MFSVEVDRSKRLLVISGVKDVTAQEVQQVAQQARAAVKDFAPGFYLLADFRWLDSMDSAAAPHIANIMDALSEKQVSAVIRVIPDPHKDIGLNILSHFHYASDVRITTVETLADALSILAEEPAQ